jgi:hypothetical protein
MIISLHYNLLNPILSTMHAFCYAPLQAIFLLCFLLAPSHKYSCLSFISTMHLVLSLGPCSGHLPPTLPTGLHYNPPYPYSSSYPAYIYMFIFCLP